MLRKLVVCCAVAIVAGAGTAALETASAAQKGAKMKAAKKPGPPARRETLACRLGTEDRHARIAVVLVGGRTSEFAYYSKWKPRTCSIHVHRHDAWSRWSENGQVTKIELEKGSFRIEHRKGEYHFVFQDIDRERYCGMDGRINGTLTIRKGSSECQLAGIMEEGIALGEAHRQQTEAVAGATPEKPAAPTAAAEPALASPAPPASTAEHASATPAPAASDAEPALATPAPPPDAPPVTVLPANTPAVERAEDAGAADVRAPVMPAAPSETGGRESEERERISGDGAHPG
jgi:hypothetical protein